MNRRTFIAALGGAAAWPVVARPEGLGSVATIGYLGIISAAPVHAAFQAGLRDLGYIEGQNLHIEFRFSEEDLGRLPVLAAELVDKRVDLIVTHATGVYAVQRATKTIPIIMAAAADVVAMGIVESLARPGGNITGLTFFFPELMAKRLALLKEVVPSMSRAGVLLIRNNPSTANVLKEVRSSADALRLDVLPAEIDSTNELESVFRTWDDDQIGGLVMVDHALVIAHASLIGAMAKKYGFPSIGPLELPTNGGLLGYGVNFLDMFRRAATFVDKVLKGAKPADIPVEQATTFKFLVNLKVANALGLEVPPTLLARADEVIE
jgi:putative tryptophan/tyrosine transport system substrate-binding protein